MFFLLECICFVFAVYPFYHPETVPKLSGTLVTIYFLDCKAFFTAFNAKLAALVGLLAECQGQATH